MLAGGFAQKEQPISGSTAGDIEVVLSPAGLLETVTVTPSRSEERLGNIPASVSILDARDIKASPALVADDVLRQLPTFSLFRRSSSLSSHPTTQGVSLRGIGPSGVSRTLVLVDGVPFNDPFGGWVYWTRVPMDSVDRIEIVDGSNSSLYGNYAMGGVINIVSSRPSRRTVELKTQYGNKNTPKVDFFGSDVWGKVGVAVEGSVFDTDGFPIVVENERGVVDNNATVNFKNVNVQAGLQPDLGRQGVLPRRLLQRGSRQRQDRRGQRHGVEVRERRRAAPPAWRERPAGLDLHRLLDVPQHVPGRAGHDAAAQQRPADGRSERADRQRRRDGPVVEGPRHVQLLERRRRLAPRERRQQRGHLQPARADRLARHRVGAGARSASRGARSAASACSSRTSSRLSASW